MTSRRARGDRKFRRQEDSHSRSRRLAFWAGIATFALRPRRMSVDPVIDIIVQASVKTKRRRPDDDLGCERAMRRRARCPSSKGPMTGRLDRSDPRRVYVFAIGAIPA